MVERDLTIMDNCINKVIIDPQAITGQGGPYFPRLVIPIKLMLQPFNTFQLQGVKFVILSIQGWLFLQENPNKIADSVTINESYQVLHANSSKSYSLEFPLDPIRILKIQEKRQGNLKLKVDLSFLIGVYETIHYKTPSERFEQRDIVTNYENVRVEISFEIQQSHWVNNVISQLGSREYFIVELPTGNKDIKEAWNYIEQAELAYSQWDIKSVFTNCRELGTFLNALLNKKLDKKSFNYNERWQRSFKNYSHMASLALHLEDINQSDKYARSEIKVQKPDAEYLLITAKSLIKYAEELIHDNS